MLNDDGFVLLLNI